MARRHGGYIRRGTSALGDGWVYVKSMITCLYITGQPACVPLPWQGVWIAAITQFEREKTRRVVYKSRAGISEPITFVRFASKLNNVPIYADNRRRTSLYKHIQLQYIGYNFAHIIIGLYTTHIYVSIRIWVRARHKIYNIILWWRLDFVRIINQKQLFYKHR